MDILASWSWKEDTRALQHNHRLVVHGVPARVSGIAALLLRSTTRGRARSQVLVGGARLRQEGRHAAARRAEGVKRHLF